MHCRQLSLAQLQLLLRVVQMLRCLQRSSSLGGTLLCCLALASGTSQGSLQACNLRLQGRPDGGARQLWSAVAILRCPCLAQAPCREVRAAYRSELCSVSTAHHGRVQGKGGVKQGIQGLLASLGGLYRKAPMRHYVASRGRSYLRGVT